MQCGHKLFSYQQKFVHDFIHFKFHLNNCLLNFLVFYEPQFDTSINLFCLVFLTLEFLFALCFSQLAQYISIVFAGSKIKQILSLKFYLSHFFSQFIRRLFDVSKYFIDSFKKYYLSRSILKTRSQVLVLFLFVFLFHSKYFCHSAHFHRFLF